MNLSMRRLLWVAVVLFAIAAPLSAFAAKIVDLDASKLAAGDLAAWTNSGTAGGSFSAVSIGGATVETVDGRKAVTFDGVKDFLKSSFTAPAEITGSHAWTVAVLVYNPKTSAGEEPLVYWAHRGDGNRSAHLNYGDNKGSGAYVHWGADAGYKTMPADGQWHEIVLTYEGGKDGLESLYVDGKLDSSAKRSLNLFTGDPIYLGVTDLEKFFSGSIAEVRIYNYSLNEEGVDRAIRIPENVRIIAPLVSLSAESLPEGKLESWPNSGTLGGSFGLQTSSAAVAEVGGRKAVSFNGKAWLESANAMSTARPFTVEYWAYRPEVNDAACPVVSFGDQQNPELARFSYSKAPQDGALLAGSVKTGYDFPAPAAKKWHHIAYTRGEDGSFKVYLDGELIKQTKAEKSAPKEVKLQIGGSWLPKRGAPITASGLSVARVCVYDEALSQKQIRNNDTQFDAFAPTPGNGAATTGFSTTLTWNEGASDIKGVDVYLGTNKADVENATRTSKAFKGTVAVGKLSIGPLPIDLEQTYYWRIDEIGNDGKVAYAGQVWSFTSESGKASDPKPRAQVSAVPVNATTLTWTPGKYTSTQTVFFSANKADVESGKAVVAKGLKASAVECKMPKLDYGTTYYWRVANQNGKHPSSTGDVWSFRTQDKLTTNDVTFFVTSDLHYGASPTTAAANEKTIDFVNMLPGADYPKEVGGKVLTPRGVVITGDLTNSGSADQWALFTKDYGVNGEGRVCFPVYENWGNHDGGIAPGSAVGPGMIERNKTRVGVKNVSENGLHYSWDWDQVHFVNLNLYAGDTRVKHGAMDGPGHEPQFSLKFLKEDLAKNVGKSGRPVIVSMHLGFDEGFSIGWGWWAAEERDALYEAIKDYNVIGILYGHTHASDHYQWKGFDVYNCASGQRDPDVGECMVFHITPKELIVLHRFQDRWGEVWRKPITGLTAAK